MPDEMTVGQAINQPLPNGYRWTYEPGAYEDNRQTGGSWAIADRNGQVTQPGVNLERPFAALFADLQKAPPPPQYFQASPAQNPLLQLAGGPQAAAPVNELGQALATMREHFARNPAGDTDAFWTRNLKRLVDPSVDPRMERRTPWPDADPWLLRPGPGIGWDAGI